MTQRSVYSLLPQRVQYALDSLGIEDSDHLTPKECFEKYCEWEGFIGWQLWDVVKACEAAVPPSQAKPGGRSNDHRSLTRRIYE